MCSGSYFAPPILRVEIPKKDGGIRPLGIPTVADRIAQMVVKNQLEPELEKYFHQDSYGYRPCKSAVDAVGQTRKRCWKYNWVLDLDIKCGMPLQKRGSGHAVVAGFAATDGEGGFGVTRGKDENCLL